MHTMFQELWKQYEKTSSELVASWRDTLLNNYRFFEDTIPTITDEVNVFLKMWFPCGYNKTQERESIQSAKVT